MDNNSKESIFLSKLTQMLLKFNELDTLKSEISNMINENPENQKQIDYKLSDYYHKLEDPTTTDIEFINIGKEIQKARIIRKDYQCLYKIIESYNANKDKLIWSPLHNRKEFEKAIKNDIKYLHEDYIYRILTEDDINDLKKGDEMKVTKVTKGSKITKSNKITKEKLEECFASGMKGIDIAKAFDIDPSMITRLKAKYGLGTRKYNKRS